MRERRGQHRMGLTRVTVSLSVSHTSRKSFRAEFLVDTGATDSMAPASALRRIGIKPVGKTTYELADGDPKRHTLRRLPAIPLKAVA